MMFSTSVVETFSPLPAERVSHTINELQVATANFLQNITGVKPGVAFF